MKRRDLEYEKNNIGYDEQYPEENRDGIKCKNYELCEMVLPDWWFDSKGCYLCTNCIIIFNKILEFEKSDDECARKILF